MEMSEAWTEEQRVMYGRVYRFMVTNPGAHCHPKMAPISSDHWETISHNAAWLAAEFMEGEELTIEDLDTGEVVATTKVLTLQ